MPTFDVYAYVKTTDWSESWESRFSQQVPEGHLAERCRRRSFWPFGRQGRAA